MMCAPRAASASASASPIPDEAPVIQMTLPEYSMHPAPIGVCDIKGWSAEIRKQEKYPQICVSACRTTLAKAVLPQ
ncbi:hypothetical protein GCM10009424_24870 [Sphingomonas ursincola]